MASIVSVDKRAVAAWAPDAIYIKDAGGLITVDQLRDLGPVVQAEAGDIPVELHSHCTTGVAPMAYMEALRLGIPTLHTATPPLAEGSGQPSTLQTARNAMAVGHEVGLDLDLLAPLCIISIKHLTVWSPSVTHLLK